MSNMLYACSMLYKTKLPLVIAFNKTDVAPANFVFEWMRDYDKFQDDMDAMNDQTYMASLNRSMGLVLDEFYRNLRAVGVSAATGEGIDELFEAIDAAAAEYDENYLPELKARKAAAESRESKRQEENIAKLMRDTDLEATKEKAVDDARKARAKTKAAEAVAGSNSDP